MSRFDDIFDSFFGRSGFRRGVNRDNTFDEEGDQTPFHGFFPSSPGSRFYSEQPHDMDDDDNYEGPPGRQGPFPGGGAIFSFNNEMNDFFKLFDDMFKSFGIADFPPLDVPRISPSSPAQPEAKAPRDEMLKEPDSTNSPEPGTATPKTVLKEPLSWFEELRKGKSILSVPPDENVSLSPSEKKDSDLDDVVRQGEMERMFGGGSPRQPSSDQRQSSYSRSISIQTIRRPDGTSETRRTERDGQGNVTTTVTTGPDDKPSPGSTEPRRMEPWGMHPWRPGQHWPFTRRCPGHDRLEGERDRTDDVPHVWRPGMSWPGSRRYPGPGRQEGDENDDSMYKKFFGSWFKP
ncbi:uncharacterized protein LOC576398 [Strongylocentrotus purpuratus]|uniref:HCLS1-associated protein X-1 n=1 Tax=Strongylocentrotus purpuratus TaxID=7668 RepID=A0A7M7RBQ6_STRPU|nr:uncharacterized protein LOC576398 [Strongylocentrotus purpuratus]|eukprot:XP_781806.1 PREDICTED: uncharacterized protein LOC576398 [Strongylocentrotus purpuratus]